MKMDTKICLSFFILLTSTFLYAQKKESVYERYLDFNMARFEGDSVKAMNIGLEILDSASRLAEKPRISFYNGMGKLYDDDNIPDKAIYYYEIVAAAVPNYYVVHRALGYLYLTPAKSLNSRLIATKKTDPDYKKIKNQYNAAAAKALQHLEIAQACDPSDETLYIIKQLYKDIGDTAGLNTLNMRMAKISKDCLDILRDN